MRSILRHQVHRLSWLILAALTVIGGCGQLPERAEQPVQAMTPPETLASLHQPDFYIRRMRVRPYGGAQLWIEVGNQGGDLGILDTDEVSETYGEVIAHLRITVTMLVCANGWDRGEDDFVCESPSHRIRRYSLSAPKSSTLWSRTAYLHVPSAWEIHVMVEPLTGTYPEFDPVIERDFPARWNNQAVMKLVMHPSRESWRGDHWFWPNSVDSLPF